MTPREWCGEHGQTKPCTGCRADGLAARGEAARVLRAQGVPRHMLKQILDGREAVPDVRSAAAGDTDAHE
jgi:hypothetical protein